MSMSVAIAEAPLGRFLIDRRDAVRHRRRDRSALRVLAAFDAERKGDLSLVDARMVPTGNDVAVVRAVMDDEPVIVKIALSPTANGGLERHGAMLAALAELDLGGRVPRLLDTGIAEVGVGCRYVIESAFAGRVLPVFADTTAIASALSLVSAVHDRSGSSTVLTDADIEALVDPHLHALLAAGLPSWRRAALGDLRAVLHDSLVGREVQLALTHGDCWPGNVMGDVTPDGTWMATGLIDWENGSLRGLPEIDLAHYLLAVHHGLGAPGLAVSHRLEPFGPLVANPDLPASLCTVLAWLAHVGSGASRAERFAPGRAWISKVVSPLLDVVADGDATWRHGARHWSQGGVR
jgi:hypothetical protein